MRVIFCLPYTTHNYIISHLYYYIRVRLDHRLVKFIYTILHTNNSTVQSIVNSKLLLYPNSVLSGNYKYIMSKYKISHLDWNMSLLYILSVYSLFSDRVGFPLHNTSFPWVLMKSIGEAFFDRMPFLTSTTCLTCVN